MLVSYIPFDIVGVVYVCKGIDQLLCRMVISGVEYQYELLSDILHRPNDHFATDKDIERGNRIFLISIVILYLRVDC